MSAEAEERPRVYLNSVHLKGFKSIEDLTIDLKKGLNILIGKNGAGKSNFMDFICRLLRKGPNSKIFYNYSKLEFISDDHHQFTLELKKALHRQISEKDIFDDRQEIFEKFNIDNEVVFDNSIDKNFLKPFKFNGKEVVYRSNPRILLMRLGYQPFVSTYIRFNIPSNHLDCIAVPGTLKIDFEDTFANWETPDSLIFIQDIFWHWELSYNDDIEIIKTNLKSDVSKQLKIENEILENLKSYTSIEDVRFNKNVNVYENEKSIVVENIKLEFKINGNWLPWSQLSDGTKRLFYIIVEITNTNGFILIEEPELGIHPHQFNLLMDFLKEQSEDKQIIISTHSPKALDHLSPTELDHILIAYYDLEKGTQIRHLSEKEIKKAQKYMKEVGFFSDYWMLSDLE